MRDVEYTTIEGVKHVLNPAKPLKGTVLLDMEKIRGINPEAQKDLALKSLNFSRAEDGRIVLYDGNQAEAYLFDGQDRLRGRLFRKGQGPGEFTWGIHIYCLADAIIVFGYGERKLAVYDKEGRFLREKKTKDLQLAPIAFVREDLFFIRQLSAGDITKISLADYSRGEIDDAACTMMLQEKSIITPLKGPGGISHWDSFGFPDIVSAYDGMTKKFYVGLDKEYKIFVKDLSGKTLYVIECAYKNKTLSRADKARMGASKDPSMDWIAARYPDSFVSYNGFEVLPKGWLAVERISGPWTTETDVFDAEGRYQSILKTPSGITFRRVEFNQRGLAAIVEDGERLLYEEFAIKILPEIFR